MRKKETKTENRDNERERLRDETFIRSYLFAWRFIFSASTPIKSLYLCHFEGERKRASESARESESESKTRGGREGGRDRGIERRIMSLYLCQLAFRLTVSGG